GRCRQSAENGQFRLPKQSEIMVVSNKESHIGPKIEGLRGVICSPILDIVPGMRTRQINRFATTISEVIGILRRGPQRIYNGLRCLDSRQPVCKGNVNSASGR